MHFYLPWRPSLGPRLALTWFSGVCLGQEFDEHVVFGETSSGVGFLVRGPQGRLEGRSIAFVQEGVRKTRFTLNLF